MTVTLTLTLLACTGLAVMWWRASRAATTAGRRAVHAETQTRRVIRRAETAEALAADLAAERDQLAEVVCRQMVQIRHLQQRCARYVADLTDVTEATRPTWADTTLRDIASLPTTTEDGR